MFCPKCRTDYRKEFTECADCKTPLVSKLPPKLKPEFINFEEILFTYNPGDIAIIKSIMALSISVPPS